MKNEKMFLIQSARMISEHIQNKDSSFIFEKEELKKYRQETICELLMQIEEVSRVCICEEGIRVFLCGGAAL